MMNQPGLGPTDHASDRRTFLKGLSAFSLALAAGSAVTELCAPSAAYADVLDYSQQETYDWMIDGLDAVVPPASGNDSGWWVWGRAQLMLSYLPMYLTSGETRYLDLLVADANNALNARDTVRNVTDYLGRSRPWWRAGRNYTTGSVVVPDTNGNPVLRMRIGWRGNASGAAGTVQISAGAQAGYVNIISNDIGTRTDTITDLSLDPASPDYIVTKLYAATPNVTKTTAVDLRTSPAGPSTLAPGTYSYTSDYTALLVDTGVITTPLAWFAAIVKADPGLHASYGAAADSYIEAVESALGAHEEEWRENAAGEGWYASDPHAPLLAPGVDWPHNQNLAMATSYLHLASATGCISHRQRAAKLLTRFKNDLDLQGSTYVWKYWHQGSPAYSGWSRADNISPRVPYWNGFPSNEDTSHAYLDVLAAAQAYQYGVVFTSADMVKLAATFSTNIKTYNASGNPSTFNTVYGGTSTSPMGSFDSRTGVWALLTPWDASIRTFLIELLNFRQYPKGAGYPPMSVAFVVGS